MIENIAEDAWLWQKQNCSISCTQFWDIDSALERRALDAIINNFKFNPFVEFVCYPWGAFVREQRDKHSLPYTLLERALIQAPPRAALVRATICQGVYLEQMIPWFVRLHITDVCIDTATFTGDMPDSIRVHHLTGVHIIANLNSIIANILPLPKSIPSITKVSLPHGRTTADDELPALDGDGLCIFTSAAFNYMTRARLLAKSVREHLPKAHLCLALADAKPEGFDPADHGFDSVVAVEDLEDEIPNINAWIFRHDVMELATAIKPFVLGRLLSQSNFKAVLFLDPDCYMFSSPRELLSKFSIASLLITPHQTVPENDARCVYREVNHLRYGIYNLGFVGVKNDSIGKSFAKWWKTRLHLHCLIDLQRGLFTDQRWIDHVPVFFDKVHILRDSCYNVACWNFRDRMITGHPDKGLLVDGRPVCFFHFAGTTGGYQKYMEKWGNNKQDLQNLLDWYLESIANLDNDPIFQRKTPYEFYGNGEEVTFLHRIVFRDDKTLQDKYPNPYAVDGQDSFFRYVTSLQLPDYSRSQVLFSDTCTVSGIAHRESRFKRELAAMQSDVEQISTTLLSFKSQGEHC